MEEYDDEIYASIEGYDNYAISNKGNVINKTTGHFKKHTLNNKGYYQTDLYDKNNRKHFLIHRLLATYFIPNLNNCECVDHIDRNPLNNSLSNLRWVTRSQNMKNLTKQAKVSSKYYGVYYDKSRNKYQVKIGCNKKQVHLGRFENERDAAIKWNDYILSHPDLLEFYTLNKID